ncbi:MAG: succinyl-diaminopimelate desuccinylase [Pseudomonadota bacterium]
MTDSPTLSLARELIRQPSVTPEDKECQNIICARLERFGFVCERLRFGEVDNLWARRGDEAPVFAFAGHTDVVPTGPYEEWTYPPFEATVTNGYLHGRGAADMKGSVAAMITAAEAFVEANADHRGSIAFLITSDEEGPARDGTKKVVETLEARGEKIEWCLVGEPSSAKTLGDIVRNGRRGSLNADITVRGKQGHVAYPQLADNPIHRAAAAIAALCAEEWDAGNDYFPATSFQVSNINSGTGAGNVIPGALHAKCNFRFSTENTETSLRERVESILSKHQLDYEIDWQLSGNPFVTEVGELTQATESAIEQLLGVTTELSTGGGTSDGRFIAPTGAQVVELGPINATIHQIDERVSAGDLESLSQVYQKILTTLLVD